MFAAAVRAVVLPLCCLAFTQLTPPPTPEPAPLQPGHPVMRQAGPPEKAADQPRTPDTAPGAGAPRRTPGPKPHAPQGPPKPDLPPDWPADPQPLPQHRPLRGPVVRRRVGLLCQGLVAGTPGRVPAVCERRPRSAAPAEVPAADPEV
jgi:hypothetical protein